MKDKDLKNQLTQLLHQPQLPPREAHFQETLLLARKEAYSRSRRPRISFAAFLSMQIKFIGWKVWTAQGISLLAISGVLTLFYGHNFLKNPQYLPKLLFCLSVLAVMTVLPFLYRSVRYQMQEIEAAARFSFARLLAARLTIIGIGDVCLLSGILFTTVAKTSFQTGSAALYLWLPFLLASSGCLFLLGHASPRQFLAGSLGLCAFLIAAFSTAGRFYLPLFQQTLSPAWILICALLIAFCTHQFHYLLHRCAYAEMQIA